MKVVLSIFAIGSLAPLMLVLPEGLARILAMFSPFLSGLVALAYWRAVRRVARGSHAPKKQAKMPFLPEVA